MAKKTIIEGGKREEIISAAMELIFENGYDATSVRSIQKKVGSEVGLFYYYFKNKDELFDSVLDRFFMGYEKDFRKIIAHGRRNPCRLMYDFFHYMEVETAHFREKYAENMHRTVRWAIREHTLTIIEPYIKQVVDIQSAYYGVEPALAPDVAALYLTHGVGSTILHEDESLYQSRRGEVMKGCCLIMGMDENKQQLRIPYQAEQEDIESWIQLMESMKEYFPGFGREAFEQQLSEHINNGEAWVYRYEGNVVAGLLYSKERKELDLLAVSPEFRQRGLATRLVETMAACFPVGEKVSVTTFRAGNSLGDDTRRFYRSIGFAEIEELTVFGYPCQRMVLTVPEGTPARNHMEK